MDNYYNSLAFIQNRCKICLYEKYKTLRNLQDFYWNHICKIMYYSNETPICSICFDDLILPRIDRCGHIFCLSCILNCLEMTNAEQILCPMCKNIEISPRTIKRVSFYNDNIPKVGKSAKFKLLVMGENNVCPRIAETLCEYKDYIVPKKVSNVGQFLGVVVERDCNVISSMKRDFSVLSRNKFRFSENNFERAKLLLSREMDNFKSEIRITERNETDKSMSSCNEKFNLLEHEKMKKWFKLFYQCESYRFAFLEEEIQEKMLEVARATKQVIPVYIRGEITAVRTEVVDKEFLQTTAMKHLFLGAKITYLSVNLERCNLGRIDERFLRVLLAHQMDFLKAEQEEEELRQRVAKRAAERRNLRLPGRSFLRNTLDDVNIPAGSSANSNSLLRTEIVEGFNTCILGIECLVPDEDYPHAENCIHYCKDKIPDSSTYGERNKYFGVMRYELNVFRGNEENFPIVAELPKEKDVKRGHNYPPEVLPWEELCKYSKSANSNLARYIVPNKPKSQLHQKQMRKIEKSIAKM